MAYKVLIIDDKHVNKELLDDLLKSAEPATLFDGIPRNLPIPELVNKLKKAYEFVSTGDDAEQKINKIKEQRDVLVKFLSGSIHAPFSFIVIKPSGEIEWVNDGFERIHGFKLSEYLESHGTTIFSLDPSSEIANLFNKCLKEQKSFDSICKVKSKKGCISLVAGFYNSPIQHRRQN